MNAQEYITALNQLADQYFILKKRAEKHHDQCVQNAYDLAVAAGWKGPKPRAGFQHLFHNWVVCGGYNGRCNEYDGPKMHRAHQILQRQWKASRILDRWYARKAAALRADFR